MADSIYSTGSRWFQRGLGAVDAVLARMLPPPVATPIRVPNRILIANTGHLGDVILSTAVLPVLRRAYPACRIGMLIGSWSRLVVRDHPLIDTIHCFDHCRLNRGSGSWWQKLTRHDRTRRQTLREIRDYDVAIDLRYYFGNAIPLLWQAGIPVRVGYSAGGFGAMLTHSLRWQREDRHVVDYFADLLRVLPGMPTDLGDLRPVLPNQDVSPAELPRTPFVIVHMGTGAACKEWPFTHWHDLTQRLRAAGHSIVLTGSGKRERVRCEHLAGAMPGCVNLCDRLSWAEYVATVRRARVVVAVDSLAGHVAAAVDTPCVIVSNGINHPAHWRPLGVCRVVMHPVACAPCYRPSGCATMECVRHVAVERVHDAIEELLRSSRRQSA